MAKHYHQTIAIILLFSSSIFAAVSDATWEAVINKHIKIQFNDSKELEAQVIAYKDSTVTIVKSDGSIESIDSRLVSSLKTNMDGAPVRGNEDLDKTLKKEKTCGPTIGFGPGIVGFNADIKNINLFASTSVIIPIATEGNSFAFSVGAGRLINFGVRGWKFNIFSHASFLSQKYINYLYSYDGNIGYSGQEILDINAAVGVGVGFQYTTKNGILISFKIPVLGFSFNNREIDGMGVLMYYPHSGASLPALVFGKSF